MPASGVSRQPTNGPDDTHRGLATWVYGPYGAGRFAARMPPPRPGSRRVTHIVCVHGDGAAMLHH
jgi:hypothetical protein